MLKLNAFVSSALKSASQCLLGVSASQTVHVRGIKTKGEYIRRFGYHYNQIYKGGK